MILLRKMTIKVDEIDFFLLILNCRLFINKYIESFNFRDRRLNTRPNYSNMFIFALDEAMPLLMAAEESLKSLNKNDISEVRSMKRPPEGVVYVIEAICIVKGLGTNTRGKVDYWELGRNMLSNSTAFLDSLVHYDKESLTEFTINKLKPYVENPAFQPKKIIKVKHLFF